MKPTQKLKTLLALAFVATVLFGQGATLKIDPIAAIPTDYEISYEVNWNTDGNTEGWTTNGQFTLDAGTPIAGLISGVSTPTGGDPNISSNGLAIATSDTIIVEVALTKAVTDTSRIDLFWGDINGGISGDRVLTTGAVTPTGGQQVYRWTTTPSQVDGNITQLRLDIAAITDAAVSVDYLRVYRLFTPLAQSLS